MADDDVMKMGLDTEDIERNLKSLLGKMGLLNVGFDKFTEVNRRFVGGTKEIELTLKKVVEGLGTVIATMQIHAGQVMDYKGKFVSAHEAVAAAAKKAEAAQKKMAEATNGALVAAARNYLQATDEQESRRAKADQREYNAAVKRFNALMNLEMRRFEAMGRLQGQAMAMDARRDLRLAARPGDPGFIGPLLPPAPGRPEPEDPTSKAIRTRFFGQTVAAAATIRSAEYLTRSLRQGFRDAVDFEVQMGKIQVVTGATTEVNDKLGASLLNLADKFNLKTSDVQAAALDVYRNKAIGTADAGKFMEEAFKLAKATGGSADDAVKALNMQLREFNIDASESAKVADVLFQSYKDGGASLGEFAGAASRMQSVLTPMGVSMKEQAALLTAFMQHGMSATGATDRISNSMIRLNLMLETNKGLQQELGASSLPELQRRFGNVTEVIEAFVAASKRGALGAADLSDSAFGAGGLIALSKYARDAQVELGKLNNSAGAAAKGSKTVLDNMGEQWEQLEKQVDRYKLKAVQAYKGFVVDRAEKLKTDLYGPKVQVTNQEITRAQEYERQETMAALGSWGGSNERTRHAKNAQDARELIAKLRKEIEEKGAKAQEEDDENSPEALMAKRKSAQDSAFDAQIKGLNKHILDRRSAWLKHKDDLEQIDKERTTEIKVELDVQLKRFEESVRDQTEIAKRAKDNVKKAEENLASFSDSFEKGRFERQLTVTKSDKTKKILTAERNASLTSQAFDMVKHFSGLSGDAMLNSKDLEGARGKLSEVQSSAEANAAKINSLWATGHATKKQVLTAEMEVMAAAEKRKELEEKILGVSKAQEKAAKEKADALKIQFDLTKKYVDEALDVKTENKNGPRDMGQVLKQFDTASGRAEKAAAAAGLTPDALLALHTQLGGARKQLQARGKLGDDERKFNEMDKATSDYARSAGAMKSVTLYMTEQLDKLATAIMGAETRISGKKTSDAELREMFGAPPVDLKKSSDQEVQRQFSEQKGDRFGLAATLNLNKTSQEDVRRQFLAHGSAGSAMSGIVDYTKTSDDDVRLAFESQQRQRIAPSTAKPRKLSVTSDYADSISPQAITNDSMSRSVATEVYQVDLNITSGADAKDIVKVLKEELPGVLRTAVRQKRALTQ